MADKPTRKHRIDVRLNDEELEKLRVNADRVGLSVAEFIRDWIKRLSLYEPSKIQRNWDEWSNEFWERDKERVKEMQETRRKIDELVKIAEEQAKRAEEQMERAKNKMEKDDANSNV